MLTLRARVEPLAVDYCVVKVWPNSFAKVDPEDFPRINRYRWRLVKSKCCFYAVRRFTRDGKTFYVRMHRQIMKPPKNKQVHHINGDTLDNRKVNLAVVSAEEHRNYGIA